MENQGKYLKLFACCFPVKGAKRSIICDLQRQRYYFIPNSLFELFNKAKYIIIDELQDHYNKDDLEIINQYVEFLLSNNLCFLTDEPEAFPPIDTTWKSPLAVTNAIIDINSKSNHPYGVIINQLQEAGCAAIQLRVFDEIDLQIIWNILDLIKVSRVRYIELLIPYSDLIEENEFIKLIHSNRRLLTIIIHTSPFNLRKDLSTLKASLIYIEDVIDSSEHCGFVNPAHFRPSLSFFTEALHNNSCLNRKISVDIEGFIKNCPSCSKNYGSIHEKSLLEVLKMEEFRFVWQVSKVTQ